MAAIVAVAFCGMLVLAFTGLFAGIAVSYSAIISNTPADLVVLEPNAQSWFNSGDMPRRVMPLVYTHPEVAEVKQMTLTGGQWANFVAGDPGVEKAKKPKNGRRSFVMLITSDMQKGALTLPSNFSDDTIVALQEPYAVAVDKTSLGQLGVKLGDRAKINGKVVYVRAVIEGYASAGGQSMVFSSRQTARLLGLVNENSQRVGTLMIRLKDPSKALQTRDELNVMGKGLYRAWTRDDLAESNQKDLFTNGGLIGLIIIFLLIFGALVGTVITWQTLRGAVFANIKEFASLRALGVSMGSLRWVIIELSFWVGVAGLMMAGVLVYVIGIIGNAAGLPLAFPIPALMLVGGVFLFISVLSGVLSLGVLKKGQPADLLR
jgi:putative ABC transport system permease protein